MSRFNNRPTFYSEGPFVVLKAFTFNGVSYQSGEPFPGDHPEVTPGPRQFRNLWEQKRIDMAPPAPAAAPVEPVEPKPELSPVDATASQPAAQEPASDAPKEDDTPAPQEPLPAFVKKAMGFGRWQIFNRDGEAVGKQSRDEAAIDAELASLLKGAMTQPQEG